MSAPSEQLVLAATEWCRHHGGVERVRKHAEEGEASLRSWQSWVRSGQGGCMTDSVSWWAHGNWVWFWFTRESRARSFSKPDAKWTIEQLTNALLAGVEQPSLFGGGS